jgi:hypothetical protein
MKNSKAMPVSLALFLGLGTLALGQASASPLTGSLGTRIEATPYMQLVAEREWWWKHGKRDRDDDHRFFRSGLWFTFPFWLGATTTPLYVDPGDDFGAEHYEYCFDRYRSYDMETNSFLGYDGLRHPCISPYG